MAAIVPAGALILTPGEAQMLYQAARLWELRSQYRVANPRLYELLSKISQAAASQPPVAARGISPRQSAATEERGWWTTRQLAKATHLAERTIRLACQNRDLEGATRDTGQWRIPAASAHAFITTRRTP